MANPFLFSVIGLDISDESFKYLRLDKHKDEQDVTFFGEEPLAKGIIDAGEIKDEVALGEALKRIQNFGGKKKLRDPYLILSLPEEKGFLRLIRTQRIPLGELRQALEFQLEEHIPFPPADLYFDYQVLDLAGRSRPTMDVVVTAYPKATVESYMNAVQKAGFLPLVFELESQAIARAVVPRNTKGVFLVGDLGKTRTTFSIVSEGTVNFTSTVKVGGRDIDAILMNALQLTPEQAKEVKFGRGFDAMSEDIIKSLTPALVALKDEADRQIGFWERRYPERDPVSRVYLCGGDALLHGLPEFLAQELRIPVERARIWENIFNLEKQIPSITARETMRYATTFGLALRGGDIVSLNIV